MTELTLTVERTIGAAQADVFNAWLDPKALARFMVPAPGMHVPEAKTDPQVGGRFEIVMQSGDKRIPHAGNYMEISRHDRIVFTWESPFAADGSEVTLVFAAVAGGTHVTLTHVRFPDRESRDNHDGGWRKILEALAAHLVPA